MRFWHALHRQPFWIRLPAKAAFFAGVTLLTLYPKVWLFPVWLGRLANLNATIDPACPGLADFEQAARSHLTAADSPAVTLATVERVVCERIPYAWDWEVWGVMDFLPTVAETLAQGREDCDGRAVVAASLLRRMGYEASLVADMKHVWVVTPLGETMSPGAGPKTLGGGEGGTWLRFRGATGNLARALVYGIGVFPLTRELIILAALCAVAVHPRSTTGRRVAGCLLLLLALALLRDAGPSTTAVAARPGFVWMGMICAAAGWMLLVFRAAGRRFAAAPPE